MVVSSNVSREMVLSFMRALSQVEGINYSFSPDLGHLNAENENQPLDFRGTLFFDNP